MRAYRKGADAERELAKLLRAKRFAVVRSARSGGKISVPDVVAIKNGRIYAFECKASRKKPWLTQEELRELEKWGRKARAKILVAWRRRAKWKFLEIRKGRVNFEKLYDLNVLK